ncbi:MAG: DegV family protein [Clostridiales bacterium]|nr:DegV family protein [Clostridiales bacterium]
MKVKIVVDSAADIAPKLEDMFYIAPLTIMFGSAEYVDGVTMTHRQFYEKLIESDIMPTTSQASPAAFAREFERAVNNGYDVVAITVSSKLSGTYQSAMIAAEDFPGKVHVVDSKSVAIGEGILAQLALDLAQSGMSAVQIADRLIIERDKIKVIAMLDTLEYLKKGGRISKTLAFAGGLLSIKPVVSIENGEIKILGKARGSKQGNNLLIQQIELSGGVDFERPVLLGYTGISDELLKKYIKDSAHIWKDNIEEPDVQMIGSVVGTHAGPGAIAAAFFTK